MDVAVLSSAIDALQAFVLEKMQETRIPGLSVSLVGRERAPYHRTFGFRDLETRRPVTTRTIFGLGSITKVFTAIGVMQLRDRGLLALDDPLDAHLGIDLRPFGQRLRIWHLLSHSSGIPALGFSESKMSTDWFMSGVPVATEADLDVFLQGAGEWAASEPGKRWFYLNEGYLLLGRLIARLSGQSYTEYVQEQILTPLNMQRTRFSRTRFEQVGDAATPYMRDRDGVLFPGATLYGEMPAAGGLASCAEDMAQFAQALLQAGRLPGGRQLLAADSVQEMQTPRVPLPQEAADISFQTIDTRNAQASGPYQGYFGCGLQVWRNFYGLDLIAHGGGVMGGTTYLAYLPERDLGLVLLANAHGYPLGQLAMVLLAWILGENPAQLSFLQLDRALKQLTGTYESFRSTMRADVTDNGDGSTLRFTIRYHHEDRTSILVPLYIGDDQWRFETYSGGRRMEVTFRRHENGIDLLFERYKFRNRNR